MDDLCIYSLIRKAEDRCAYTRQYCNDESAILFTQHYFCTVNENILVLILITVLPFSTPSPFYPSSSSTS